MDWTILSGILLAGIALVAAFIKMHQSVFDTMLRREFDRLIGALEQFREETKNATKANHRRVKKLKKREDKRDETMVSGLAALQLVVADLIKRLAAHVAADVADKLPKSVPAKKGRDS
jgi:hypothetical protein